MAFLDAVGAIHVLGGNEAIGAVGFGNALIKRTAGDLKVVRSALADTAENALPRHLVDEVAAGNPRDSGMAFHNTSRDNLRVVPPSCGSQTLDKLAASDRRVAVGENNARITRRCIAQLELATVDGERRVLSLDGGIEELQLDTYSGKTIPDAQNETPKIDEDGYPTAQDYQAYKREMAAVASYIGVDGFEMEYKITAKGYPYAVISRETNEKTGQVTELHIIPNEQHERLSNREYVLQKHRFAADGAESASAEIVDFYLVDCATLEVTDEHTTQWHKANRS